MAQLGHTDPAMTLGIYARVMLDGEGEREALRALVEGADWAETARIEAGEGGGEQESELVDSPESASSRGKRDTRPAGFEPAASRSGGGRSIH